MGGVRALDLIFNRTRVGHLLIALYILATLRSGNSKAALVAVVLIKPSLATASFNWCPQMFGYLFLVLYAHCVERFRKGHEKALWFLPPLVSNLD